MSADALEQYLNAMGIIGCNVNPYLPALDDLGFCWQDMTALSINELDAYWREQNE